MRINSERKLATAIAMDSVQQDVLFIMAKMQLWIWGTVTLHLLLWLARTNWC
jgi:hypothetical protein